MKINRSQYAAFQIKEAFDLYIGMDNGVSGTVGMLFGKQSSFRKTPVHIVQDFQKTAKNVTRVDPVRLAALIFPVCVAANKIFIMMERPMLNPRFFNASISAARAHESTLIVVDALMRKFVDIEFAFVDSKEWQKEQLPAGTKGSVQLKLRSMQYGCRHYPEHSELITKHKDADGLLIARHCKEINS